MGGDLRTEVKRLLEEGRSSSEVKIFLEQNGFNTDAIEEELASGTQGKTRLDARNSFVFTSREILDRIGYGASTPQFINILLWFAWQTNPYIIFIVGMLNGVKVLLSILWSNVLQEYNQLHQFSRNTISFTGILYGFSFFILAFGLLMHSLWIFAIGFLAGAIGIVAYGDLYRRFVHDILRREHMGRFLRGMVHWGVLITAVTLLFSGYLLDAFPMEGIPVTIFGYELTGYGFLFMFEITAIAFILSGYVTSFVQSNRQKRSYSFKKFIGEYYNLAKDQTKELMKNTYFILITVGSVITGLLQILLTSYAGIAIYQILTKSYTTPFFTLAIVYSIAVIASFTGPFFTQKIHRSTGLAPTLVFGTLLMAILPLVLVYRQDVVTITAALSLNVIGGAIVGFAQGMLARKLLPDHSRTQYFRVQSLIVIIPYLIFIPLFAWIANTFPLAITFHIVTVGLVFVVMPLYFLLVVLSQQKHL